MPTKYELKNARTKEREFLRYRHVCPDQILRFLLAGESATALYEKREAAFRAFDEADRVGDGEVTEFNLKPLRRVLNFMYQECQYKGTDAGDFLQQVQTKVTPGWDMATDMFEAINTEACIVQLKAGGNYGFAQECALRALRAAIKRDLKKQIAGSDDKKGIAKSLLLLADVYERINESMRASQLRAEARELI
jgi:hypothetical protein